LVYRPAYRVGVVDTTGAGDAYMGGLSYAMLQGWPHERVAAFATTEAPFEVALLLDTSGSTREEVALIRRAANAFIESLRPGDRVAVLSFNTIAEGQRKSATVEVLSQLTDDRATLRVAVQNIGASHGTPYYDALGRVAEDIFREPPTPETRGRRALVALTDGVDSTSEAGFADARAKLSRAGVLSYFVEVDTEDYVEDRLMWDCRDDGALRLSRSQLERYRLAFDPRADSAEIGSQYSLGYYSENKARDGGFRRIRVEVRGLQGAQVSAREGYRISQGE
jgi:hypothetical protein